jgi:hypothetical protein
MFTEETYLKTPEWSCIPPDLPADLINEIKELTVDHRD